jgi:hypothetical protein
MDYQEVFQEDTDFSFEGYQVVRREFFAHTFEPALTIRGNSIFFNTACIRKSEDVVYVQLLINQEQKKIVIRPCGEDDNTSCQEKPNSPHSFSTALALGNKEGDVAAASHLGHHEIHRPNTGIQATRTKSTTVTGSFLALFMLVGANLAGYFRLHHPGAQPLQHAEHRIRAVHELE